MDEKQGKMDQYQGKMDENQGKIVKYSKPRYFLSKTITME